jgi:hypothetical protein
MIFDKEICPLCQAKLEKDEQQEKTTYWCPKVKCWGRNWLDTDAAKYPHYAHVLHGDPSTSSNSEVSMLIPPYMLEHKRPQQTTGIYTLSDKSAHKLIVRVPLLDRDYSQADKILETLKTLVIFS